MSQWRTFLFSCCCTLLLVGFNFRGIGTPEKFLPIYISIPCTFIELFRWHFLAQFSPSFTQLECFILPEPLRFFREKLLRIVFRGDQIAEKSERTYRTIQCHTKIVFISWNSLLNFGQSRIKWYVKMRHSYEILWYIFIRLLRTFRP